MFFMIETTRLNLCRPTPEVMPILENLWRDEKVRQFLGGVISDDLIQQRMMTLQNHWDVRQFGQWVVFERASNEVVGLCGLHTSEDGVELSYMLFPRFWGKGLAGEAAAASLEHGFGSLRLDRVIAITQESNIKSCRLLRKIGMQHVKNFERFNAVQCLFEVQSKSRHAHVSFKALTIADIPAIVDAFQKANWPKEARIFEFYYREQVRGERIVWVAYVSNQFAGYVTLKWQSQYGPFATANIPEIMDLNVLPYFRKRGVGAMLLDIAETEAATQSNVVGLGVGLYGGPDGGYGVAQRLYVRRGYIPDGKGVTYDYQSATPGNSYRLNDDLVLWLTKKLR